jgi:hypothetical protein
MPDAVKKTRPLDYAPPLTVRERAMRYLPSGEQSLNFLKNLLWVVPLTLLIWIYAEREQTVTLPTEPVSIDVRTNDHNRIVNLRLPQDKNIIVELSGPRARIDRVRELLQPNPEGAAVQIYVDPQIGLGPQQLLTISQINNLPVFKNNGITVKSAQPPYLSVDIDEYDKRMVPLRIPPELAGMLSDQTRFVPDMVEIRAPKQAIEKAEANNQLFVYPDLPKRDELKTRTGAVTLENVPVYWPDFAPDGHPLTSRREHANYSPQTVSAKLDIKQRDLEYVIPSVPIFKETPNGFENGYTVVIDPPTFSNVTVTGPAEQIDGIRKGTLKVKARLEISSLDLNKVNTPDRKPLQWDLPPGVTLSRDTLEKSNWGFTIKDRER